MIATERTTEVWKTQHDFAAEEMRYYAFLYDDWIFPNRYEDFRGLSVLDAGSGPGIQVDLIARYAKDVVAVDLEAIKTTLEQTSIAGSNISYVHADIATMDLCRQFDVVNCVGVIHHTDNPTRTFENLKRHTKKGGKLIVWAYAWEGNTLMRTLIEPLRKMLLGRASHFVLWTLSCVLNGLIYIPVNTIYRIPLKLLPYYEYFGNYRKLSFRRNTINVYDKLNAPQTHFLREQTLSEWFNKREFDDIHISMYRGVSWRASGTKR